MSDPYVGEIRMFAGNFAPQNWAFCNGQLMPIAENEVLFSLIGTTYGGDGQTTFALPDLRGRVPIHIGGNHLIGEFGGSESVTLSSGDVAAHGHPLVATSAAAGPSAGPTGMLGSSTTAQFYGTGPTSITMATDAVSATGGAGPHDNMAPFLATSFIIALYGIYPSSS